MTINLSLVGHISCMSSFVILLCDVDKRLEINRDYKKLNVRLHMFDVLSLLLFYYIITVDHCLVEENKYR